MTHSGEKPHKCSQCDFSSITNCDLTIHIRRAHTGKKAISVTNALTVLFLPVIYKTTKYPMTRRRISFAMIATKLSNMNRTWSDMVLNTLLKNRFSFLK